MPVRPEISNIYPKLGKICLSFSPARNGMSPLQHKTTCVSKALTQAGGAQGA